MMPSGKGYTKWNAQQYRAFRMCLRIMNTRSGLKRRAAREQVLAQMKEIRLVDLSYEAACHKYQLDPVETLKMNNVQIRRKVEFVDPSGSILPVDESEAGRPVPLMLTEKERDFYRDGCWVYDNLEEFRSWMDRVKDKNPDARPVVRADAPGRGAWGLLNWAYGNRTGFYKEVLPQLAKIQKEQKTKGKAKKIDGVNMVELEDRYAK